MAAGPERPNFIVLFADDLGYGDLGCYGHPTIETPNLDRMAADGTRFTSYYAAASVCTPSRVGLLTGRNPVRAGRPGNTGPETVGGLPLTEILLPQVLKPLGYRTMAIGKWHLGHQPAEYLPVKRGFDSWFGLPYSNDMIKPWVQTEVPLRLYRDAEPVDEVKGQEWLTPRYTEEAQKFIRSSGQRPFFLYLPYSMPHLPISVPDSRRGRSRAGLFGDVIETLDWSVGEILRTVREQGLDRRTMVVFTSDNGPWLDLPARMLAGGVEPWHTGFKNLLRGAKGTSYEGGFRVPGIVRWPGVARPQVIRGMASALDLFPTIANAAGAPMPGDRKYDGVDLAPVLREGSDAGDRSFYYVVGAELQALREGPWKLRQTKAAGTELFHLDWDPAEQYNRAGSEPGVVQRLSERMRAYAAEVGAKLD
jgi:arylsulfatase A-like enzyme